MSGRNRLLAEVPANPVSSFYNDFTAAAPRLWPNLRQMVRRKA